MNEVLTHQEFMALQPIKHKSDLDTGDVIYLSCGTHFKAEDNLYHLVFCDFRCGKDDFAGERYDGRRVSWCDMDRFSIVGKVIFRQPRD